MTYLTDSVHLFEVVAEQADRNYGRLGGWLRRTILRDCVSGETAALDDFEMLALAEVRA